MRPPFSLYIHIPYCVSKCPYCDFNSHVVAEIPEDNYTDALLRELEHYGTMDEWQDRTVQSIFFGGGTPSTFKPASIGKLLAWVAATFPINLDCEITLEANPGTVDSDYRGELKVALVNLGAEPFRVTRGMRIAQMVVAAVPTVEFLAVTELPATQRADGGFGSTGS